jgi:hypothetical protein
MKRSEIEKSMPDLTAREKEIYRMAAEWALEQVREWADRRDTWTVHIDFIREFCTIEDDK